MFFLVFFYVITVASAVIMLRSSFGVLWICTRTEDIVHDCMLAT